VDGTNGDILFSWANLDQASKPSAWEASKVLPSPSQLNSSPDIVVDAAGRIVIVYAVPLNENRGIYLAQSTDNGFTWSSYSQVFDGVASEWDIVDSPKITLSGDGNLHVLFTRQSIRISLRGRGFWLGLPILSIYPALASEGTTDACPPIKSSACRNCMGFSSVPVRSMKPNF
jgi:hypothetical protein